MTQVMPMPYANPPEPYNTGYVNYPPQGQVGYATPGYDPNAAPTYDTRAHPYPQGQNYVHGGYGDVNVIQHHKKQKKFKNPVAPIIIFMFGFLCCPIWFLGICFLKKKKYGKLGRRFAIASISCGVFFVLWIAILIGVLVAAGKKASKELDWEVGGNMDYYTNPSSPWFTSPPAAPARP